MSRIEGKELFITGERPANPYREAFYRRQAEWHRYEGSEDVRVRHEIRTRHYEWFTRGWLPEDRDCKILDIGCGSGQFLHTRPPGALYPECRDRGLSVLAHDRRQGDACGLLSVHREELAARAEVGPKS